MKKKKKPIEKSAFFLKILNVIFCKYFWYFVERKKLYD